MPDDILSAWDFIVFKCGRDIKSGRHIARSIDLPTAPDRVGSMNYEMRYSKHRYVPQLSG
jgi:hypothetical protein